MYIEQDDLVSHKCSSAIPSHVRSHVAFCHELPATLGGMSHTVAKFLADHYTSLPRITYFAKARRGPSYKASLNRTQPAALTPPAPAPQDTCGQDRATCKVLDFFQDYSMRDFAEFTAKARPPAPSAALPACAGPSHAPAPAKPRS